MTRRLKVPFLVDLVLVDKLEDMRALNRDARVDRGFQPSGPLVNRFLQRRFRKVMHVDGALLPAFTARGDAIRAQERVRVETALDERLTKEPWRDSDIEIFAEYVRGRCDVTAAGVAAQEVIGRLFLPDYRATPRSYRAAKLLDAWLTSGPIRAAWWRLTGALGRASREIWSRARNDPHCIHGTTIAVHNLVQSLTAMRALAADPARRPRVSEETVVQQSLAAPRRVLRRVSEPMNAAATPSRLKDGTLLLFQLRAMHAGSADTDLAFMAGEWSRCPARTIVPALLRAVWRAASRPKPSAERREPA